MPCYPCVHCNKCGMYSMSNDLVCAVCGAVLLPGRMDCAECGTPIGSVKAPGTAADDAAGTETAGTAEENPCEGTDDPDR